MANVFVPDEKAGSMLMDLRPDTQRQGVLFDADQDGPWLCGPGQALGDVVREPHATLYHQMDRVAESAGEGGKYSFLKK